MKFKDLVKKIKEEDFNRLWLIRKGNFYCSYGEDAKYLSKQFGFKLRSEGENLLVGFPIASYDKYIKKINDLNISYSVLNYSEDKFDYETENKKYSVIEKVNKKNYEKVEEIEKIITEKEMEDKNIENNKTINKRIDIVSKYLEILEDRVSIIEKKIRYI